MERYRSEKYDSFPITRNYRDYNRKKWNKAIEFDPAILQEPAGFWEIECDIDAIDDQGLTEKDKIWKVARELVEEKMLIQAAYKEPNRNDSTVSIKCFLENYLDVEKVIQSALELRKRVHFPSLFYMKTNYSDDTGKYQYITRYLYCCDGDFYERMYGNQSGFRLLRSNSSITQQ